jgi:hypothetical protein
MDPRSHAVITPSSAPLSVHDHEESDDDLRKEDISFCAAGKIRNPSAVNVVITIFGTCDHFWPPRWST